MTTIVYRDGILAADSCYTEEGESGGSRQYRCKKLYEFKRSGVRFLVGLAGGQTGLTFLRWFIAGGDYNSKPELAEGLNHDFTALVVEKYDVPGYGCHGQLKHVTVFDQYFEPEPVQEDYHAIGCGAKCAFVALDMGATALEAVEAAAKRDPYTRGPFQVLK